MSNQKLAIIAVIVFLLATSIYFLTALRKERITSPTNAHFDLLANSFLQGQLFIPNPPSTYDLTLHNDHWYVPFPPMPALLLLPFVATVGIEQVNTVFFSIVLGALNVSLIFLILQTLSSYGWSKLGTLDNLWLTILFGIGSVHWYMAPRGTVWMMSQICTIFFFALAVWTALIADAPVLSGSLLGAAMLGRPHIVLGYPLLAALAAMKAAPDNSRWGMARDWVIRSAVPLLVAVVALLAYNWARFENPFDFGYLNQNVYPGMLDDLKTYGQFNLHFVPRNFWTMFLALPTWNEATRSLVPTDEGLSIFVTTPALIYLARAREKSPLIFGAWMSIALLLIPLMLYYNTGAQQLGYRFSLDLMLPAMILLSVGVRQVSGIVRVLIVLGVVVNAWGVILFNG